jgi:hypothetical protein
MADRIARLPGAEKVLRHGLVPTIRKIAPPRSGSTAG